MLKVVGNVFSSNKEDLNQIAVALEAAGFELAYSNETSATVIKEVEDLND